MRPHRRPMTVTALLGVALLLASCGSSAEDEAGGAADTTPTSDPTGAPDAGQDEDHDDDHDDHDHDDEGHDDDDHDHDDEGHDDDDHDHGGEASSDATEQAGPTPRVALTYDGGLLVLDAVTGEVEGDLPLDGFNRISDVGDGRHVLVATEGGWAPLDTGTWSQGHGDHDHYYTATPQLHDVILAAETPAHVVVNDGLTALFDDGTGEITIVPAADWAAAVGHGELHPLATLATPQAHHGVAVPMADGRLIVSEGDDEARTGARVLNPGGEELEANDQCPGLHGYAVAADDAVMLGCDDGVLLLHGDHFHKLSSPDNPGRIGNGYAHADSAIVLGDYRTDPDANLTHVTLIDTQAETIEVLEVGAEYTWRGLARGAEGEALVFGTDGDLRVMDPETGEVVRTIEVMDEWEVPEQWQQAHPAVEVLDGMAYITEPREDGQDRLHIVDYSGGEVWRSVDLPETPIEMVGVTG